MKAYKIEVLVIDHENIGEENIRDTLSNVRYINVNVKSVKSADIGDWDDDHPLNKRSTCEAEYERLFKENPLGEICSKPVSEEDALQSVRLKEIPRDGLPPIYITVFQGIGGWNSGIFEWNCDGDFGFYEPQITGFNNTSLGNGSRKDAVREAISWAKAEELPYWIPEE